jgi:hypothetical protein
MFGAITPAMLVILLRPYGYEVTLRCLTDWRFKGDLPPLEKISRGYCKGVLRCWKLNDILALALAVCRRRKDRDHKRTFGIVHMNWLGGADIPVLRAQKSWIKELKRTAHISKSVLQQCTTKLSASTALTPGMIRDVLDEILCILFQPLHAIGKTLDIAHTCKLVQRVINGFCGHGKLVVINEVLLLELLRWLNAYFSPAARLSIIASATSAELRYARDSYLNWWRLLDASWQQSSIVGGPRNSSLMPLAISLAPLIVPLLLPVTTEYARLACR